MLAPVLEFPCQRGRKKLMSHQHLIYQIELQVEGEVIAEFDIWLAGHVEEMLAISGFLSAEILADSEADKQGVARRTVQYRVISREALEHYFTHDAERMRAEGQRRFGGYFEATRRVFLASGEKSADPELELLRLCKNCSQPLTGQYCNLCGQRDRSRMISLWELFRDLVGDLFELDSRLWRSVLPLLFRPGQLTQDYLAGRQVRYTPPLRMYIVISIVFFVIASFGSTDSRVTIDGQEVLNSTTLDSTTQQESIRQCDEIEINFGWQLLDRPEVIDTVRERCRRIVADQGKSFLQGLYNNLPKMIFLFLPLIALVQKVLYLGSRRYYVEHLLFFVHFHSFFFLSLVISILLARLPRVFELQGLITTLAIIAISVYIPVYLFKAMRRVYGQGFGVTLIKYALLFVAYIFCLMITMAVGLVYTALSV